MESAKGFHVGGLDGAEKVLVVLGAVDCNLYTWNNDAGRPVAPLCERKDVDAEIRSR